MKVYTRGSSFLCEKSGREISRCTMRGADQTHGRMFAVARKLRIAFLLLFACPASRAQNQAGSFPPYLANDFDYANFTRFQAAGPPKDLIYQSNGFMAL